MTIGILLVVTLTAASIAWIGWSLPLDLAQAIPGKVWLSGVVGIMAFGIVGTIMAMPVIIKAHVQGLCLNCGSSRN